MKGPTIPALILTACLVAVVAIGLLHYLLPPDVSSFIAYLIPIVIAAHTLRLGLAVVVPAAALAAWITVHTMTNSNITIPVLAWNSLVRAILFFGTMAYGHFLSARIRSEKEARQILESRLNEHNPFSKSLLSCGDCGCFNTESDRWLPPPQFISERAGVEVFTCICPECLKKRTINEMQS